MQFISIKETYFITKSRLNSDVHFKSVRQAVITNKVVITKAIFIIITITIIRQLITIIIIIIIIIKKPTITVTRPSKYFKFVIRPKARPR